MNGDARWVRHCTLLFLGWVVMYAQRASIPALLALMQQEWAVSRTQLGLVTSVFFVAYTLVQLPAGYWADRWGPRRIIVGGQALQGGAALGAALAGGFVPFIAWRAAVGLGQGSYYSAQYALATTLLPRERRATGLAFINSGMAAGTLVGLALAGLLAYRWLWPWRWVIGLLGLAGLAVTWLLGRSLPHLATPPRGEGEAFFRGRQGALLGAALGAAFTTMYGLYTILSWTPYYLREVVGLAGHTASLYASLVPAVAIPAGVWLGMRADRQRRGELMLRLVPLAALACLLLAVPSPFTVILGLVLYGATGKLVLDPLLVAGLTLGVPPERRGRAFAWLNLASSLAAVLAPVTTGYLADLSGSFLPGWGVAALLHLPAWLFIRKMEKEVAPYVRGGGAGPTPGAHPG